MANEDDLREARRAKFDTLLSAGSRPFPNDFRVTDAMEKTRADVLALALGPAESRAELPDESSLQGTEADVWMYGRVVSKRGPFLVLRTPYGDVQTLVRPKDSKNMASPLPETDRELAGVVDLADHVAVFGPLVRTGTGELAIRAHRYRHVGKAMLPPPAKWHGLKDVEKRYRERYVDLWANPEVGSVFRARSLIVRSLRRILDDRGFLEVETPMLHRVRGGATARPFSTHHNALDMGLFLRIAPELYLKRLVVGGMDRVYEIGRNFRNEGTSTRHNPEFTMLEFYAAYCSVDELIPLTEALLREVDASLLAAFPGYADNRPFTMEEGFAKVPMREAIAKAASALGFTLAADTLLDPAATLDALTRLDSALAGDARAALKKCQNHGQRVFVLYEFLAEAKLTELYRSADGSKSLPVFITEYPAEVSPLARRNDDNPMFVDRFELFVDGRELANAFSELNDPDDQAERFHSQLAGKANGDEEAMDYDDDYIRALSVGMPPAAGFGMGVDRLVMTLCNQPSIRDVLLFPLLRPEATAQDEDEA